MFLGEEQDMYSDIKLKSERYARQLVRNAFPADVDVYEDEYAKQILRATEARSGAFLPRGNASPRKITMPVMWSDERTLCLAPSMR